MHEPCGGSSIAAMARRHFDGDGASVRVDDGAGFRFATGRERPNRLRLGPLFRPPPNGALWRSLPQTRKFGRQPPVVVNPLQPSEFAGILFDVLLYFPGMLFGIALYFLGMLFIISLHMAGILFGVLLYFSGDDPRSIVPGREAASLAKNCPLPPASSHATTQGARVPSVPLRCLSRRLVIASEARLPSN